jgi:hypothetical protein
MRNLVSHVRIFVTGIESEYRRHGTLAYLAAYDVHRPARGQIRHPHPEQDRQLTPISRAFLT